MPLSSPTGLTTLKDIVGRLENSPEKPAYGSLSAGYAVSFAIPYLPQRISKHYADLIEGGLDGLCKRALLPPPHPHFGLVVEFAKPNEVHVFDDERVLDNTLRELIGRFGTIILRNAYMAEKYRKENQRNIFPDLSFHVDRGKTQKDRYSLFTRDPFDSIQQEPRQSSTLIVDNVAAYLQLIRETGAGTVPLPAQCKIFNDIRLKPLIGNILLEQAWNAPHGTGEICMIDNATVLHASYYKPDRGYPIGVRYLF